MSRAVRTRRRRTHGVLPTAANDPACLRTAAKRGDSNAVDGRTRPLAAGLLHPMSMDAYRPEPWPPAAE